MIMLLERNYARLKYRIKSNEFVITVVTGKGGDLMYRSNCHIDYNPPFLIINVRRASTAPRRPSGRLNLTGLEQ